MPHIYPTGNSSESKPLSEKPKFQFRGIFLPAEVILKWVEGEITETDLKILILVEALVTPQGEGCWASNEYISGSIGIHFQSVHRCINRLVKAGLLIRYDGERHGQPQRYLETTWSRTGGEGRGGKPYGLGGVNPRVYQNTLPTEGKGEGGANRSPTHPTRFGNGHVKSAGNTNGAPSGFKNRLGNEVPPAEEHINAAKRLGKSLRENKRFRRDQTPASAGRHFEKLAKQVGDYSAVLEWYCSHSSAEDQKRYGLPRVESSRQFCRCYGWIEDCMNRAMRPPPENRDRNGYLRSEVDYIKTNFGHYPKGPVLDKYPDPMPREFKTGPMPKYFYVRNPKKDRIDMFEYYMGDLEASRVYRIDER